MFYLNLTKRERWTARCLSYIWSPCIQRRKNHFPKDKDCNFRRKKKMFHNDVGVAVKSKVWRTVSACFLLRDVSGRTVLNMIIRLLRDSCALKTVIFPHFGLIYAIVYRTPRTPDSFRETRSRDNNMWRHRVFRTIYIYTYRRKTWRRTDFNTTGYNFTLKILPENRSRKNEITTRVIVLSREPTTSVRDNVSRTDKIYCGLIAAGVRFEFHDEVPTRLLCRLSAFLETV